MLETIRALLTTNRRFGQLSDRCRVALIAFVVIVFPGELVVHSVLAKQ